LYWLLPKLSGIIQQGSRKRPRNGSFSTLQTKGIFLPVSNTKQRRWNYWFCFARDSLNAPHNAGTTKNKKGKVMKKFSLFVLLIVLLTACGTLSATEPSPPNDTLEPQVIDNIPNSTRESLVKILPTANDRFFVVAVEQNTAVNAVNRVFIRRYFVTSNGVGLDTAFAQNGQLTFVPNGQGQRIHDAVILPGAVPQILMVGSTVNQGNRVPIIARVSTAGGFSIRFLVNFPGEEPRTLALTNQNPARIIVGLEGLANNRLRILRLLQGTPGNVLSEFLLDTTFAGDGSQEVTVPAPNILGFNRLQVTDLELTPTNTILLVGNGFQPNPNPLGGERPVPFAVRVSTVFPNINLVSLSTNIPLERVAALAIDANNRLVLAGTNSSNLAVARLNNNLTRDLTFNNGLGFNSTSFASTSPLPFEGPPEPLPSHGSKVSIDAQGRIVVAGSTAMPTGVVPPLLTTQAIAVARFLPNGPLDTTFGQAGRITRSEGNASTTTQSLQLFSQNRMVVGGTTSSNLLNATVLSLQRFVSP
jgi:hypothetical protein